MVAKSQEEFISQAIMALKDFVIDLSNTVYKTSKTKVTLRCSGIVNGVRHGAIECPPAFPSNILKGHNPCPTCKANRISAAASLSPSEIWRRKEVTLMRKEEKAERWRLEREVNFKKQASEKHLGFYCYKRVDYINCTKFQVTIVCPSHGDFPMLPIVHLMGSGCPKCRQSTFQASMKKKLIDKAISLFKEIYDYSHVVYVDHNTKVLLFCNSHQDFFWQRLHQHLRGTGCGDCKNEKIALANKLPFPEFLERARQKFGQAFAYDQCQYMSGDIMLKCLNLNHPAFSTTPQNHLRFVGGGCRPCGFEESGRKLRSNTAEFVEKALARWGTSSYDYSYVDYETAVIPVKIICMVHGAFWSTPNNHLSNHGCPTCAGYFVYNTPSFITRVAEVHQGKYIYDKVVYVNRRTSVVITCPTHGDYDQKPSDHLSGCGCPECKRQNARLTQKEFLQRVIRVHGDRYLYDLTIYTNTLNDIIVSCRDHGPYPVKAYSHLNGVGCRKCHQRRVSRISMTWLAFKEVQDGSYIQHNGNEGEFPIMSQGRVIYRLDGYAEPGQMSKPKAYDFLGDYWHGNPKSFSPEDTNPTTKKTFGSMFQKQCERRQYLLSVGYDYEEMWEQDWRRGIKAVTKLQRLWLKKT